MKYDERARHFNMDTGCVELRLRDGRMISIDCTGVEPFPKKWTRKMRKKQNETNRSE